LPSSVKLNYHTNIYIRILLIVAESLDIMVSASLIIDPPTLRSRVSAGMTEEDIQERGRINLN